ncbi:uncharacterized protein LOC111713463 [Eurytemora carolleeae]|uniref:uncharacterized protein LOC111713463 n=1 Tax=Eurytemora carolleeae TaxID=1294199 RepID=UPI000C776CAE|nr:uncharacterized protein LOC111713463 [Eurytemora carolleeae]|eukprot:XP_023344086.1 uncharacterized protein LOC111713463 [Eurytemora affinis]
MFDLQRKYLLDQQVEFTLSAIPDIELPDEAFSGPLAKFGEVMIKKTVVGVQINLNTFKFPELPGLEKNPCEELTKPELKTILENGAFTKLQQNNLMLTNWIPVLVETESDLKFVLRKDLMAVVEGDKDNPNSLSILTMPFPSHCGLRNSIDIYSQTDKE